MEWIDVKEKDKLPEDLENILFTDGVHVYKGYRMTSSISEVDFDYWYSVTDSSVLDVSHWMPLPKPPGIG